MILVPQIRRSTWTSNGVEVRSVVRCSGQSLTRIAGRAFTYRPLYTVEVFFGSKVARVRNVHNAAALAWEFEISVQALVELGAVTP